MSDIESKLKNTRGALPVVLFAVACAGLLFISRSSSIAQSAPDNRQLQRGSTPQTNQTAQSRIALVIGNGAYTNAPPLKNPPNDARDMAVTLRTLGFEVTSGINVNQRDMKRLIREFGHKLKAGGSGLFYYAGHGVQSKGKNYLIPVEADIQSEVEVEDAGVDVNLVLGYMDDAQNGLNIVILDACRNNPFGRSFRSAENGLAQVDAPTGTLIAYSTAPGRVASDGSGQNGLYTSQLLKAMRVPGLSATDVFMQVRVEVMKQTHSSQVPWEASSLVGSFYFNAETTATLSQPGTSNNTQPNTLVDPAAFELAYWESIKSSNDPEDFKAYLNKYPEGQFSAIAKRRLLPKPNLVSESAQPIEAEIEQAVALLPNLGSTKIDLGRFGEEIEIVRVIGRCQLKYEARTLWNSKARFKPSIGETSITLSEINVASIAVTEATPPDRPAFWMATARTLAGRTFTYSLTGYENRLLERIKIPTKTQNPTSTFVGLFMDAESANRYAKAFANAAKKCGGKSETF